MRRFTLLSIAFGTVLCLTGPSLFAQSCVTQCPGACLRNSTSSADGVVTSGIASRSPSEVLSKIAKLAAKLQTLLPADSNVREAASGFDKFGQFVAALHVAHNLGIPFDQLKSKLVGSHKESLTKAIQELSPDANTKAELKRVHKQTDVDLSEAKEGIAS